MIAALRRSTVGVLPDVRLLVHQRRGDLLVAVADEAVRIECQLVPPGLVQPAVESIGAKVAERVRPSLVRYKNVRQRAAEQRLVEVLVRGLQTAVLDRRDRRRHLHALTRHDHSSPVGWYD
jgi:hypothetical protein